MADKPYLPRRGDILHLDRDGAKPADTLTVISTTGYVARVEYADGTRLPLAITEVQAMAEKATPERETR